MKALPLMIISLFSLGAFAQDFLTCEFKITDNKTKSNAKILRTSATNVNLELVPGMSFKKDIIIDRVIAYPGQSKSDKYLIRAFRDDTRDVELSSEKSIPLTRLKDFETINMTAYDTGNGVSAHFRTTAANYNLTMTGQGITKKFTFLLYSKFSYLEKDKIKSKISPVLITCQRLPKSIIDESEIKKGELLDAERQIHQDAKETIKH